MANAITDNRTQVDAADTVGTVWVDLAGSALTADTEIFIQGSASMGNYATTATDGIFYRWSADQDLTSTHIYMWVNCGVVSLLQAKASQGLTFRARGPTVTNYLEWDYAGSDDWPTTFEGGWFQLVVDISSTPTRTGGTPPAITAIREVGITFDTASVMPRMADNIWVDEVRSLADGTAGITVQGRNGGSTDWTWADLPTELGAASGAAIAGPAGTVILNTPVEFFADDGSTHAFTSNNEVVLWDDLEFVAADAYKITVLGDASGTANWSMGTKTGSGTAASGAQGGSVIADSGGVRWDFDADIANIDSCNLFGVTCVHGGDFQLDDPDNEVIGTLFIDCTTVEATTSNEFIKNSYIDANTAADAGSLIWNENVDVDGILDDSTFEQGTAAHHAIDFGTAVASNITLRGCNFNGFSGSENVDGSTFRFLATSGSLTLNLVNCTVDGGGPTQANIGVDDAAGIAVTVTIDPVATKITVQDADGGTIENARVFLETADDGTTGFPYQDATTSLTQTAGTATLTASAVHDLVTGDKVVVRGAAEEPYNSIVTITVTSTTVFTYPIDSGATSPAGGTPVFSYVPIQGLTDVNGEITSSKIWPASQSLSGWARKSTASPFFKQTAISIADASGGTDLLAALQPDE